MDHPILNSRKEWTLHTAWANGVLPKSAASRQRSGRGGLTARQVGMACRTVQRKEVAHVLGSDMDLNGLSVRLCRASQACAQSVVEDAPQRCGWQVTESTSVCVFLASGVQSRQKLNSSSPEHFQMSEAATIWAVYRPKEATLLRNMFFGFWSQTPISANVKTQIKMSCRW